MKLTLPPNFKEFLQLLNQDEIEYLLVGGYAVGLYGYVRYTKDIDIWIATHPKNIEDIKRVLSKFGFTQAAQEFSLELGKFFRLSVHPMAIELLTSIDGVDFKTCYLNRELVQLEDLTISVIDLERRINKRASGRRQDLANLSKLLLKPLPKDA